MPVDSDARVEEAIRIGQDNKTIIELAQNWCAHLTCERFGGVGMVEMETGLPIGMRRFQCPHASAEGMAGMDLRSVVLDFHDRNCAGCQKRLPVRLPNLSELVAERDRDRQNIREDEARRAEFETERVNARSVRREQLSKGCDVPTAGIFNVIDQFDRHPDTQHRAILVETAAAASSRFNSGAREALFDLAEAGGHRTETALEVWIALALNLTASAGPHFVR